MRPCPQSWRARAARQGLAALAFFSTVTAFGQVYDVIPVAQLGPASDVARPDWRLNSSGFASGPASGNAGLESLLVSPEGVQTVLAYPQALVTLARGMNDRAWVVGSATLRLNTGGTQIRPFLWRDGGFFPFPSTSPAPAFATDVNNRGAICGTGQFRPGHERGYVWEMGRWIWLPELPSVIPVIASTHSTAMNDRGDVIGLYRIGPSATSGPGFPAPLLWRRTTPSLTAGPYRAPTVLPEPVPGFASWPNAISARGLIAGHAVTRSTDSTVPSPLPVYWNGFAPGRLPTWGGPGQALGVNDVDEVVGWLRDRENRVRAVLWMPARPRITPTGDGGGPTSAVTLYFARDLNLLIQAPYQLVRAVDVNDAGEILCQARGADGLDWMVRLAPR